MAEDALIAIEFLKGIFAPVSEHPIFLSSLPNDDARDRQPGEKALMSRDPAEIGGHFGRWNRKERGLYYCVATLKPDARPERAGGSPRCKANVSEIVQAHTDVDKKDILISLEEVIRIARQLPCRPSIIVSSGRGLHLYWLLKEALLADPDTIARIEGVNALLADLMGGDHAVSDVCRLMRLPGSHNTKGGAWTEVEIVDALYDLRYEPEEIEEMLDVLSPRVERKHIERRRPTKEDNPFLAIAKQLGFKPPLDVEQALASMSYQGPDGTSIHETQLSVSAALINRGATAEEATDVVIEATMAAAGEYGTRWNWTRERRSVHRMCEAWVQKKSEAGDERAGERSEAGTSARGAVALIEPAAVPAEPERPILLPGSGGVAEEADVDDEKVIDITTTLAKKKAARKKKADDKKPIHVLVGETLIEGLRQGGQDVLASDGQIWRFEGGLWAIPQPDGRWWLEAEIERVARALDVASTARTINEARLWITRNPDIRKDAAPWDQHGKIPTKSGLLDWRTGKVEPMLPEHHATWRLECEFDPSAECPLWKMALSDMFADRGAEGRDATVAVLQEMLGVAMIENRPKALSKALVLQGGGDSGKTTFLEVAGGFLSPRPITTPLDMVGETHGLMDFQRRAPWVLNEAFDQSKWLLSSVVKSLLTGDPVHINVKNGPMVTRRFEGGTFWGTNHPPSFKESTKAIVNRLVVIHCRREFSEASPTGAARIAEERGFGEISEMILALERPGVLNWALEGLRRAMEQRRLSLTDEMQETRAEIRMDSNLAAGFVAECVEMDRDGMVSTVDFCAAFAMWWAENKGEGRGAPSNEAIGKALAALGDARIATARDTERRYYVGLHLNPVGLDFWAGASGSTVAQGKTTRLSSDRAAVNRQVPPHWEYKAFLARVRKAFEDKEAADRVNENPGEMRQKRGKSGGSEYDSSYDSCEPISGPTVMDDDVEF